MAVEVKRRTRSGRLELLNRAQAAVMAALKAAGLACYVSDGDKLERFDILVHGQNESRLPGFEPRQMLMRSQEARETKE